MKVRKDKITNTVCIYPYKSSILILYAYALFGEYIFSLLAKELQ